MKILYITTIGVTMGFFESFIKEQLDIGNQIDIATNENDGKTSVPSCYREWGCKIYHLDTSRSPVSLGNIRAIKQIRELVNRNHYDMVHCHTPLAAAATRMACKHFRKHGLKVVYTAHGFHFYNGASLKNWLIYYPIEKILSKYTDILITINKEDYKRASTSFHAQKTVYVPGVGIDTNKFALGTLNREKIRTELKINDNQTMLLSVGELNENKNHENVIKAISGIKNLIYVIVGKGVLKEHLKLIAEEFNVEVKLVGFRSDVADFYQAADIYILPSIREGLNVSLMEAMAASLPCLAGKIRGNVDLLDEKGEELFNPSSCDEIRHAIKKILALTAKERKNKGECNLKTIRLFDKKIINASLFEIYQEI